MTFTRFIFQTYITRTHTKSNNINSIRVNSRWGICQNNVNDDTVSKQTYIAAVSSSTHAPPPSKARCQCNGRTACGVTSFILSPETFVDIALWALALPHSLSTYLKPSQVPETDITPEGPFHSSHMSARSCRKLYHIFQVFLSNFAPREHAGSSSN